MRDRIQPLERPRWSMELSNGPCLRRPFGCCRRDTNGRWRLLPINIGRCLVVRGDIPHSYGGADPLSCCWRQRQTFIDAEKETMSFAKVIEMSAHSTESFQDAAKRGAEKAKERLDHVQSIWVKDHEITMNDGQVTGYKVHLKVTFEMRD